MINNRSKIARFALYLFMFSINFEVFNLFGDSGALSVGRLTGFIYIGAFYYANYRVSLYQLNNLFISLIAFILLILVTSTFHINYLSDRIIDISLVQNIVLFFLLLNHEKYEPGVLKKSIYAFAFGSSLLGVFYIYGIGVEYTGGRLSLFEDNENAIGIRMAISSIYLINSFFALSKKFYFKKSLIVLPVPLLIIVMMGTSSRVAFISFCVMLLALLGFYFLIHPIKRLFPIVMISGLVAYFFIPFILSNDLLINRLLASKSGDLAGRGDIWLSYIPSIWKSPIFGYGFSGYEKISMNIFGQLVSPHNVIIEVLLYSGFAGFAFYMWFNAQVIFSAFRMYSIKKECLGLVLLIPYAGGVLSGQVLVTKLMWFILAFNCISLLNEKQFVPNVEENISPKH